MFVQACMSLCCLHMQLTYSCGMYFPFLINWTSPFPILELLGGIFHFYSNFKRHVCKQTVENLIRRRILWHLIWFCTVCQCPTKRLLGFNGLKCQNLMSWLIFQWTGSMLFLHSPGLFYRQPVFKILELLPNMLNSNDAGITNVVPKLFPQIEFFY